MPPKKRIIVSSDDDDQIIESKSNANEKNSSEEEINSGSDSEADKSEVEPPARKPSTRTPKPVKKFNASLPKEIGKPVDTPTQAIPSPEGIELRALITGELIKTYLYEAEDETLVYQAADLPDGRIGCVFPFCELNFKQKPGLLYHLKTYKHDLVQLFGESASERVKILIASVKEYPISMSGFPLLFSDIKTEISMLFTTELANNMRSKNANTDVKDFVEDIDGIEIADYGNAAKLITKQRMKDVPGPQHFDNFSEADIVHSISDYPHFDVCEYEVLSNEDS